MAVTLRREENTAYLYQPVGKGFRIAAALVEKGWDVRSEQWNSEDDLVRVKLCKDMTSDQLATDIEVSFPDEDFKIDIT